MLFQSRSGKKTESMLLYLFKCRAKRASVIRRCQARQRHEYVYVLLSRPIATIGREILESTPLITFL